MTAERLQKIMADGGVGSRRYCESLISGGQVKVNGQTAYLGSKADLDCDDIEIVGWGKLNKVDSKRIYIVLNKPRGFVSTVKDQAGRPTVMEFVRDIPVRIYPVGRLDRDTEGLLVFTNDGALTNKLLHPSSLVDKVYIACVDILPGEREIRFLEEGICLDDGWTAPAKVKILAEDKVQLTIHEGRKRQVRRMLAAVGCRVKKLERVKLGPICLGNLPRGRYRRLSDSEVRALKEL
ncbi:MAG: pseudouridine synthase [Candidatus Bruticola sp.]